jgi:hypothetical protein
VLRGGEHHVAIEDVISVLAALEQSDVLACEQRCQAYLGLIQRLDVTLRAYLRTFMPSGYSGLLGLSGVTRGELE